MTKRLASVNSDAKISIVLPDLRGGGAERLHVQLANDWQQQGLQVGFALLRRQGELIETVQPGIEIVDLGVKRIRDLVFPLLGYFKQIRPDIVIAAMWPLTCVVAVAWWLAGRPGRLYLSDHNQLSLSCVQQLKVSPRLLGLTMRLTYRSANGVIAVSESVKQDMCELSGLPPSSIRVIYNPAATGVTAARADMLTRHRLWGAGFKHHIVSIGSLKTQKDHATLIQAFSLLSADINVKLTILGEGALRPALEHLVYELGLGGRVSLPGFVVDPYPWLRSADLFVLSSKWEGFGNVIVEALECGVPVVSTDCPGGPAEILENGRYGALVPVCDPAAMADAMRGCLNEASDRARLIARAQDFSVPIISEKYLHYFFSTGE